jgi:hypothetical protein
VHASNPRKVWAALAPANVLLTNKAPYLVFIRGDTLRQAYLLGMLGSSVVDWFGHLRVVLNLNFFILYALPIPTFSPEPMHTRVANLAASLAVTRGQGDFGAWADLAVDEALDDEAAYAEIDALASLIYGLEFEELALIWADASPSRPSLHRVLECRAAWESEPAL